MPRLQPSIAIFCRVCFEARAEIDPLPWTRLSRAECLLLALALYRSARAGRQAGLNGWEPESFSSN